MVTRVEKFFVLLLALSVFLPVFLSWATAAEQPQQATASAEPSELIPSAAVAKMLDDSRRMGAAKQPVDSLKAADEALAIARQTDDRIGLALAQEARARTLRDLERTEDALTAWRDASQIWAQLGDTPEQITALVQAGLLCVAARKSEAQALFAQGLSVAKSQGPRPAELTRALQEGAAALDKNGEKSEALNYLDAALGLRENLTAESLPLVELLNTRAGISLDLAVDGNDEKYYLMGKKDLSRAVDIGRRVAPDSSTLVESLRLLCFVEKSLDTEEAARGHCLDALRIQKKLSPDGSMVEAKILFMLARLETQESHFAPAHTYFDGALALCEKLAPESETHQDVLLILSTLEITEGNLQSARSRLLYLLAIKEKQHQWTAPTYVNLGSVALDQNDFEAAHQYLEKALDIFLKTKPNNVGVQYTLGNLSLVAYRQGDFGLALEYGRRVIDLDSRRPDGLDTAEDYDQMGDIFLDQGNLSSAVEYYHRALVVRTGINPESLDVSYSLANLAKVARAQGNRTLALEYDRRALDMGRKSCPNSWCVTAILNDLGKLAYEQGDLESSENYLRQAVDVREQSLGAIHPDRARSLRDLALTLAARGKTREALDDALRAERIGAEHLRVSVRTLSERQALAYEAVRASGLDLALTLIADHANTHLARDEVFDAVIRSRSLVFDELAERHRSAHESEDPEITKLAEQLSSARTRLATLVLRGAGDMKADVYRSVLDETRAQKEKAERVLAEKSMAFREDQARTQIGIKEVSESLPQDTTMVAFVRYDRHDLQAPRVGRVVAKPVPWYAAFVLRARDHQQAFVQLGSAREIETRLAAWRRDIARQADAPGISSKAGEDAYARSGAALRRMIWDPLVPSLGHATRVFVVPDATLHLVNLESLPSVSGQYLIETGPLIHYLSTERDLVPVQARRGEGILLVGNPAFNQDGKITVAAEQQSTNAGAAPSVLKRGSRSDCKTFQTLRFPPLPASQQEVDNIATLWRRSTAMEGAAASAGGELLQMTGADASPEAFERYAPGKRVLHVATHGFFLEGNCKSAEQLALDANKGQDPLPATADNPLLLSGLAFAGANRRGLANANQSDGILTAEEIAGINLQGIDWAVLSACDTGVGEVKVGEGVFGLRRAFQVAGAKTVIMSLWPVEDESTRQWMGTLYREHFLKGKDTGESVRAASLQLLRQRRAKHQSTHPFYWAAFIAVGDWR